MNRRNRPSVSPVESLSEFALQVVQRLRGAGHEALWAGGCVRDRLRGVAPKDYDVATSAKPDEVQALFGPRRTIAVGKQFGVIVVASLDRRHQVEVATFRRDFEYVDGRRPTRVEFTSAEEDARRRDFTINGLFYDPIHDKVIDYVGGQADLHACVVRAIDDPVERFEEDKLRMLRAVRFATTLDFTLEDRTRDAVRIHASDLVVVSAERLAIELRKVLESPHRSRGVMLLLETGLLDVLFPETRFIGFEYEWPTTSQSLASEALTDSTVALAILFRATASARRDAVERFQAGCARLKLSNREQELGTWLLETEAWFAAAHTQPWPQVQRVLVHDDFPLLLQMLRALAHEDGARIETIRFCEARLAQPPDILNPKSLISGDDLLASGIPPGPQYRRILQHVRDAQLLGEISSRKQAIEMAKALAGRRCDGSDDVSERREPTDRE